MNKLTSSRLETALIKLNEVEEAVNTVVSDLQEQYDNMTENVQNGEKGEELNEQLEKLEEIVGELTTAQDSLDDIVHQ